MNVEAAYDRCEQITAMEARNFSYGIRLLPPQKRRMLSAVYALARRIDDIGDGDAPAAQRLRQLDEVRAQLDSIGAQRSDPVWIAVADAVDRVDLPLDAFAELIDGCRADVEGRRYRTFDELRWYCRCVAGSIGRLSLAVFGSHDRARTDPLADALGLALQLTNILRDVLEDRRDGRIYLPSDELRRFECRMDLDPDGHFADDEDALLALIEYQAARAAEWYHTGLQLLPLLDHRSRACCSAMAGIYHRLLRRIMARPWQVLEGRISLPGPEKLAVAARALAGVGG